MYQPWLKSLFCAFLLCITLTPLWAQNKILFIRGGDGTVGFLEGGSNEQGADLFNFATNPGNHGWGELGSALIAEGFTVEQMSENPVVAKVPRPVPLDTLNLSQYAVIVFGSNNADYTDAQKNALVAYVQAGGGVLFVSDGNFGPNWAGAPSSDQKFMGSFGLVMNQDSGTYAVKRADNHFFAPTHPILNGVNIFDGEGVSAITVMQPPAGVTNALITKALGIVQRNNGNISINQGKGSSEPAAANDASLAIAEMGLGRVAAHFDRNTFFNANGAGTDLHRFDNERFARNLFNWLARRPAFNTVSGNYAPRVHFPNLSPGALLSSASGLVVQASAKDIDGTVAYVELSVDGVSVGIATAAPYSWTLSNLSPGQRTLKATVVDNKGASTSASLPVNVANLISSAGWTVAGFQSNGAATGNAGFAIDGNPNTRWATNQVQAPNQRFAINFGKPIAFERVVLKTAQNPDDYPRGYLLKGSNNGVDYVNLTSGTGSGPTTDISLPQPVTYQFLEIVQTGTAGVNWWSIHDLELYAPGAVVPPVSNMLSRTGWTVSGFQSNGSATGNATLAIDGSASTRWETSQPQTPGQRFVINMGKPNSFSRLVLKTDQSPNDYPRSFVLRGSNNGIDFVNLASGSGSGATTQIVLPQAVTYQFVEIAQTGTDGYWWWSIHEVEAYGSGPAPSPAISRAGWTVSGFQSNGSAAGNAASAVDGAPNTRWASTQVQAPGQRFVVNMGQPTLVARFVLKTEQNPNDYPRGYLLRGSSNGTDFVDLASGAGTNPITDIVLPQPATYQFFEIRQTGAVTTGGYWWSIHELEAYGP